MARRGPERTLKLTLTYDGTPFVGWQRQAEGTSIQGLVEDALSRIEGAPVAVVGAGRTDAGVHACAQVASTRLTSAMDLATLGRALNANLPREVRVTRIDEMPASFHARYDATSKTYRFLIVNGPDATPFEWRYVWHVCERLDVVRMGDAAALFEGEHDFAAFRGAGSSARTSVRRVMASRLTPVCAGHPWPAQACAGGTPGGERLVYEVTANGFLRHMVRTIVGTLVEIGAGRRDTAAIARAFSSGNRADAGPTAPACGLWLVHVDYRAP